MENIFIFLIFKDVYGEEAVKQKTVSCEKHFSWSVDRFASTLVNVSKSAGHFKERATKLMTANTPSEYNAALQDISGFIDAKPKREFLKGFVEFWHPRRHHFSRAFKNPNAPKSNLSESYHSKYVNANTINLTLLDAAHRDTAASIKLEQALKMFGKGFKCQGSGPTTSGKNKRSYYQQKGKVSYLSVP